MDALAALLKVLEDAGWSPFWIAVAIVVAIIVLPVLRVAALIVRLLRPGTDPAAPTVASLINDLKDQHGSVVGVLQHQVRRAETKADKAEAKAENARRATAMCEAAHQSCMRDVSDLRDELAELKAKVSS